MNREKLKAWAESLTEAQAKALLLELIEEVQGMEVVVVPDTGVPYWEGSGEDLDYQFAGK
jgi:hypothetical protein